MDKNEVLKILETAKDENGEVPMRLVRQAFEKLPEPCEDTISRRAAIEAVKHITSSMSVCVNTDECHGMKRMQRQAVIELVNLPSAQPEIIRCKECKHYKAYEYTGELACHYVIGGTVVRNPNDFCSRAERITE